ncbi:TIGR04141 family sporadically distributed protein [Flavobacterium sp. SM15]|uniref:DUF6119 family protein n=1 Tax=Flavobacterium sp. SM15 TaxID=2908005 RepID=UPI001EDBECB6|nr:DUF6119 family protein [Flavobacterium sp. SM15]MCG2611814.1 TIGR04141 family sporadically distributed protein [Flavobacterium sp. SM15]
MSDKIQSNFYLLKDTIKVLRKSKVLVETIDFKFLHTHLKKHDFKEQKVIPNLSSTYEIKVYFKKTINPIKWKGFMNTIVQKDEEILKNNKSISESYVILFHNTKSKKYFASTGGFAHVAIQDVATNDFGLEILSRVLKAEDKNLRSSKERNLTGGIQGAIKFFRNDYNLYENESFGNIYNELNASINKDQLNKIFGFSKADLKSDSLCIAKNSFSIKKSISFIELLNLIEKCEKLINLPPVVEINSVEKVNKSNSILINDLWEELLKKTYSNYQDPTNFFSVEIAHKDFEKYYYANSASLTFSIKQKKRISPFEEAIKQIQTILDEIRNIDSSLPYDKFKTVLTNGLIETFDANGDTLTRDTLTNHFCSEITYDGKSYFLIERDWYVIGKTFIDNINEQSEHFITINKYTGPTMDKWTSGSENDYNKSYFTKPESLVFDKFTPLNIEACDIFRWDQTNAYFFHIKKGFDNSMRDLCSQVLIAARKVKEDSKNNFIYLENLYDTVINNNGTSAYSIDAKKHLKKISKKDFINIVRNRNIVFVLAVLDTASNARKLETDIVNFDSNIAKFSLNELSKNLRNLEVDFKILQLEK